MMAAAQIYCMDTSGWLDGWARHYPPDVFPSQMLKELQWRF